MNRKSSIIIAVAVLMLQTDTHAAVTHWRFVKGAYYLQSSDNAPDVTTTNWGAFSILKTDSAGDATSVVIQGGNIVGSLGFDQDGSEWELNADFASQSALDAVLPSEASYSIILSGGSLGTVTQQFTVGADAYPATPYLTGADYSDSLALEALEPFEFNWNAAGETTTISLEIFTGAELDEGDNVYDVFSNNFTSAQLPWDLFDANSNYNGFIDFANATNFSGVGGFGIDGDVSFNKSLAFHINTVNTAVDYDDFSGGTNGAWIPFLSEPGKALTPTNDVLEYTSGLGPDADSTAWIYDTDSLTYTQDWSVAVDIANFVDESTLTGGQEAYFTLVVGSDDLQYLMLLENYIEQDFREVYFGVDTNGMEDVFTVSVPTAEQQMTLKISFDATREVLTSTYSFGGDYQKIADFSTADWGFADTDTFLAALSVGTAGLSIAPGELYADNFRIYEGGALSNDVGLVELEFLHSFGDGSIFLESNWIEAEAGTSARVTSMDVLTSGGDAFNVPLDWVDGGTNYWDVDVEFPFAEAWDPANDGDWIITFGLNNGTYQSTVVPFTKEDGTTALPSFYNEPMFVAPSPANGLVTDTNTFSFAWQPATANANFISIEESIDGEDVVGIVDQLYSDGLPGDSLAIAGETIDGPLATTSFGPVVFEQGFHRMRVNEGYGRAAINADGIPYVVVKQNESDILFTITADVDGDAMDDSWEIQFFGGTNVVNGGANDDFDGDGFLNIEEFIAGVNPTNGGSVFGVEQAEPVPAGYVVSWNAVSDRKYGVYWTTNLVSGFETLATDLLYPINSYTDTVHSAEDGGFYYIDVQLQD
jgi:hypothetical protein